MEIVQVWTGCHRLGLTEYFMAYKPGGTGSTWLNNIGGFRAVLTPTKIRSFTLPLSIAFPTLLSDEVMVLE